MKNAFLAILSLGALGLVSAAPAPAGGFYPSPGFPYPYPYPPIGGGVPLPKSPKQMCNCNNPTTKETHVSPMCEQSGGQDQYRVFESVEPIKQHMCIISTALSEEVFNNEKCRKEFGESYNAFCGNIWGFRK
ncbi:hypothetical protein QBC38DRAFT_447005 [Podospora fimiseda]|uniref:Uncharacterized protein n=1 Tax=Podospora fimiseda TaxID=252190 RepID=A0AAN7GPE7_9PEZI|nr:hypothetical protein QBC38DRAFT_447005 [Podospora fimiseda]